MTTKARTALDEIFGILEGEEWDSDTMSKVGEVITRFGYVITDPNITDPNDPKAPLPADTDGDAEYSYAHIEAAACMWEHVLHALRKHRESRNPWDEYREAYGMCNLRETVIRHAPVLEVEYQKAVANGYDKAFDWEYVPKYMEDHVARILT